MCPFALDLPAPALFNNLINKFLLVGDSVVDKRKNLINLSYRTLGETRHDSVVRITPLLCVWLGEVSYDPSYLQAVPFLFRKVARKEVALSLTLSFDEPTGDSHERTALRNLANSY